MPVAKGERMATAADVATPVEAGTLEISVTVTVTYRTSRGAASPQSLALISEEAARLTGGREQLASRILGDGADRTGRSARRWRDLGPVLRGVDRPELAGAVVGEGRTSPAVRGSGSLDRAVPPVTEQPSSCVYSVTGSVSPGVAHSVDAERKQELPSMMFQPKSSPLTPDRDTSISSRSP
jgi:hypothetical protein